MSVVSTALFCDDILNPILSYFDPGPSTDLGSAWQQHKHDSVYHTDFKWFDLHHQQRTLARVSRVCRAFYDPALDLLWRDVDGQQLFGLMRCLGLRVIILEVSCWTILTSVYY